MMEAYYRIWLDKIRYRGEVELNNKVSIIMGVYNGSRYIRDSIDSIINQTYKNWEFIICDDCSSDNTIDIIQEYMKNDSRIKLIKNDKNIGLAATLNKCLGQCTGEYIARQDDDDISLPERLEKQVKFLEQNTQYDLVGSRAYLIDKDNNIWGKSKLPTEKPESINLLHGPCFIHPTIMIRKIVIDELNGYNEKALRVEDYDLWFRFFANNFKAFNMQESLIKYRLDTHSYKKRKYKYRINEFKVKIKGYKINNIPYRKRIYALKPLIIGLIPSRFISKFHSNKFSV